MDLSVPWSVLKKTHSSVRTSFHSTVHAMQRYRRPNGLLFITRSMSCRPWDQFDFFSLYGCNGNGIMDSCNGPDSRACYTRIPIKTNVVLRHSFSAQCTDPTYATYFRMWTHRNFCCETVHIFARTLWPARTFKYHGNEVRSSARTKRANFERHTDLITVSISA